MPEFIKIVYREKFIKPLLAGTNMPVKLCDVLFCMHWVFTFNILSLGLTTSCSTKKIITKLKDLQPKPPIDTNKSSDTISYPIKPKEDIIFNDNYSFETFMIIILTVIIFCFINSEYPGKLFKLFKKK